MPKNCWKPLLGLAVVAIVALAVQSAEARHSAAVNFRDFGQNVAEAARDGDPPTNEDVLDAVDDIGDFLDDLHNADPH